MQQPKRLLLIAAAGAATIAAAVLFMTEAFATSRLLYAVLVLTILAGGAGMGAVHLASLPTPRRPALRAVTAFAKGMTVATIAFAVCIHFASLEVEDPGHRVAWPLFAVLFVGIILFAGAVFSATTVVTSAMVRHRRANRGHSIPDA